jgi:hypothetical protein
MLRPLVCSAAVIALLASTLFGQSATSLRGQVTDPSGAAVAGASVRAQRAATNLTREVSSNADGFYEMQQLPPGNYSARASAKGFAATQQNGVELLVNVPATVDFRLEIATASEVIQVAEANAPMVNAADATLGQAFNTRQVEQLPIEARNVVELLSLQPGVTFLGDRVNRDSDTRSGAVNGARSDQSNVTLDGVDVNDQNKSYAFTSVLRNTQDSIQEFRVTTSNPNAD